MAGVTPESEWDEQQVGWMLALHEYRSMTCPGCGGDLLETTSHDAWDPVPPLQCHRCDAIAAQQDRYAQDYKHLHTLRWGATRRG